MRDPLGQGFALFVNRLAAVSDDREEGRHHPYRNQPGHDPGVPFGGAKLRVQRFAPLIELQDGDDSAAVLVPNRGKNLDQGRSGDVPDRI